MNFFLYFYTLSVSCGEPQQGSIPTYYSVSDGNGGNNPAAERMEIPDLNVPLEGLFEDQTITAKPIVESRHRKRMRRLKETGKLDQYREKQRAKLQKYYSKLSPAEKKLKYTRSRLLMVERLNKVSTTQ